MAGIALVLVLCAGPMHAGWNLLARRQRAEGAFFAKLLKWIAGLGLVPALLGLLLCQSMPAKAWLCAVISGTCCGAYYLFLAKGYARSDFTIVYPIARALPVLLVGLADIVRGHNPSAPGWAGMSLVVVGCLLTPISSFREIRWQDYIN